jgi:hypothetical protein
VLAEVFHIYLGVEAARYYDTERLSFCAASWFTASMLLSQIKVQTFEQFGYI